MMRIWSWRHAVAKTTLEPMTKLVLYTLAIHMNDAGEGCYPSLDTLMAESGMARASVVKHLALAEAAGFIRKRKHGYGGQKWARNEYFATYPTGTILGDPEPQEKGSSANEPPLQEGSSSDDIKAVQQVNSNSAINSPDDVVVKAREAYGRLAGRLQDIITAPIPLNMTPCLHWLDAGADVELDIIPTVEAICIQQRAKEPMWSPRSIRYFGSAVMQALADRKAGVTLPPPRSGATVPSSTGKQGGVGKHSGFGKRDYSAGTEGFNVV